ncbi:MAG TPA: alpha/beta hydrolase [Acidimicrobiales bacterium]|nr:alpha/beta hydrolase [Acidimicrobiales bacterium]
MGNHVATHADEWPSLVERPARGAGDWPAGVRAVLVHGAMDRGAGMAAVARELRDAPTLRYDRRGYGRAVRLGSGDLVRHVDDLLAIVGTGPVVLFGHSFGGLVVLAAAATGRLDVRGVATWEVPTPWIDGWTGWELDDPGDVEDRAGAIAEAFMRRVVGTARYDALPEKTRAARRREGPALIADMDPLLTAGAPFDPSRVTAPCEFGAGDVSPIAYTIGAKWLAERVPDGGARIIGGARHGAPMSRAADVATLIREVATAGDASASSRRSAVDETGGHDAIVV